MQTILKVTEKPEVDEIMSFIKGLTEREQLVIYGMIKMGKIMSLDNEGKKLA